MSNFIWLIENFFTVNRVINQNTRNTDGEQGSNITEKFIQNKLLEIINSKECHDLMKHLSSTSDVDVTPINKVHHCIQYYFAQNPSQERALTIACIGIAALQLFVQLNWTGPEIQEEADWPGLQVDKESLLLELALDAETVCPVVKGPHFLLFARAALITSQDLFSQFAEDLQALVTWWSVRCISVHQAVLEESSVRLHSELAECESKIAKHAPWLGKFVEPQSALNDDDKVVGAENKVEKNETEIFSEQDIILRQARALFWAELARVRLQYSEVQKSRRCLEQALKAIGLEAYLAGALGKRTRFQVHDLPQLTLRVSTMSTTSSCDPPSRQQVNVDHLPRDIKLNDEVRLPRVNFVSEQDGTFPSLTPVEQAVLLACYGQILKSQPKDAFAEEELLPYLDCILSQPQSWSIQLSTLLARCKLEAFHRRTVERSMTQVQLLVECITSEKPDADQRLGFIYVSQMMPRWKIEAELASLLISLGAVNSALDIFIRLQMWEDVTACYHLLELRHKAAEIVRQELERHPSPKLWCMLGDATHDVTCYETAWKLSEFRSAKAQRHWGFYYFSRKENALCIPHLEQSLQLNSLQPLVLSRLAYSYLQLEDWEKCARTYRQLCTLDGENFEAWNNLAKAYVKLGEKARAWKVLQESIKCNFENWQVWDNLMVVSIDCMEYQEAIRAYHRLLDLKGSHVDTQVLSIIVQAVTQNLPENRGQNAGRLLKKALELFGRLTSIVTNNAKVWQLYAQLASSEQQPRTPQTSEKVVQLLLRAQRCATQAPNWFREISSCKEASTIILSLADTCLELSQQSTVATDGVKMIASPRLAINSMITKIKSQHLDPVSGEVPAELSECVTRLTSKMEELVAQNKLLTSSN